MSRGKPSRVSKTVLLIGKAEQLSTLYLSRLMWGGLLDQINLFIAVEFALLAKIGV